MTWESHINENCRKAMNRLTLLKKLSRKITRKGKLTIYLSYIRPILEFGFQMYINSPQKYLNKLEHVQREALLFITRAYKKTSHKELLKEVGLTTLEKRRDSSKIQFIFKAKHNLLPNYLQTILPPITGKMNTYNMRNSENYQLFKSKKNYFLKSYIPSTIKIWNDSSLDIKRASSLTSLKSKLSDLYGSTTYHLYLSEDGNGAVNHSRIRMGLSGLNAQRRKYNFIDSSKCDNCNDKSETPKHYFLFCSAFAAQRRDMLYEMEATIPQTVQPYMQYLLNKKMSDNFTNILIYGTKNVDTDSLLFKIVQTFIMKTNRFNVV